MDEILKGIKKGSVAGGRAPTSDEIRTLVAAMQTSNLSLEALRQLVARHRSGGAVDVAAMQSSIQVETKRREAVAATPIPPSVPNAGAGGAGRPAVITISTRIYRPGGVEFLPGILGPHVIVPLDQEGRHIDIGPQLIEPLPILEEEGMVVPGVEVRF